MILAIDYDKTYTLDPLLWDKVIGLFIDSGHTVKCVTMRRPNEGEEVESSIGRLCEVVYTSREAKVPYSDRVGMKVDVWVDDSPWWLLNNG